MFRLTNKLAVSNLIKNRKLYYPFALAVLLAVTITYLFYSLTLNPNIGKIRGGETISMTLGLGMVIVTIASAIIVFYANSFVMKNRSKELGIYGMLGLEKRHLISMVFKELLIFGSLTLTAGLGLGALFDKLIFALLLKLMNMKVELVATFQPSVFILVSLIFGAIFLGLVFINAFRIARMNALQLSREKASGEKKGRFLGLQTILGLISMGAGYFLAVTVENPLNAVLIFFVAVLLVIFGTYLLFNAGITVFLQILKKNKRYYYQPNNMISVSNLIFRMKKNAVGLATIAILSTMVLVTMSAATSIFSASETFKKRMKGIHPKLQLWLGYMLATCPVDIFISEGVRTLETQQEYYSRGRTKPGTVITWVDGVKSMSMHQIQRDGYGHAVDIYYVGWKNTDPANDPRWQTIYEHAKLCAKMLGLQMEHGRDWKRVDSPHHQLMEFDATEVQEFQNMKAKGINQRG